MNDPYDLLIDITGYPLNFGNESYTSEITSTTKFPNLKIKEIMNNVLHSFYRQLVDKKLI